ncbi:dihydroorotase [Thermosynechococcaceae cyanobacterium BACA0444]|uniref:Dihydroorotase n=1 Tax=Pseudocalidococcus azoricus BACA0444 TaxID=2918990 RepID=A0AAE4FTI7_9CYAN|nr:dihydroorotase [Pseudocalidococcus azoricus]MDS3860706.1 dihydroorotase [Pseudocalidococcus azoricus BACA0444]
MRDLPESYVLQGVRIIDPTQQWDFCGDVWIEQGQIRAIERDLSSVAAEIPRQSGAGLILAPGLVDLYSQGGEPGYEQRETLESLIQAAQAGGFCRVALLPLTNPVLDHAAVLSQLQAKIPPNSPVQLHFWGAITQAAKGEKLTELYELAQAGVIGFSDSRPLGNLGVIRRSLEYLQATHLPIALWPQNLELAGRGVVRESEIALALGLIEQPVSAETTALTSILELSRELPQPLHVMRVSTARSVELLESYYHQAALITSSVSWLHLLKNTNDLTSYDPNLRLEPPLGTPEDQTALIAGIKSGVINAIAVDHRPRTYEEKVISFAEALPGAIGLELALPLLWQELVVTEKLTALELWRALSQKPAEILQQSPPSLRQVNQQEWILFDPNQAWTVTPETLFSRSQNTSYTGQTISGRVIRQWSHHF